MTVYTKKDFIAKAAANSEGEFSQNHITKVLNQLESTVDELLASPEEVEVKICHGLSQVTVYREPYEMKLPFNGETISIKGKYKVRAKVGSPLEKAANAVSDK